MLWENRLSFHNLLSISGGKKWSIYGKSVLRVADARNNQFHYNLQRKSLLECATVRCFMGGSYYGSPLARNLNENLEKNLQPESLNYNLNVNLNANR